MKKILVIEDDNDIAFIVEMALHSLYNVKTQSDNDHITDSFEDFKPDLVLLDNYVGQRRATDIVTEIRGTAAYNNIPFVLFSGHQDIKRIAREIDAMDYLAKPFDLADLYSCIERVLLKCA